MTHRALSRPAVVGTASPVGRPLGWVLRLSSWHAARISGPPTRWMAPSTPPPPSNEELAALTIASASTSVMSPTSSLRRGALCIAGCLESPGSVRSLMAVASAASGRPQGWAYVDEVDDHGDDADQTEDAEHDLGDQGQQGTDAEQDRPEDLGLLARGDVRRRRMGEGVDERDHLGHQRDEREDPQDPVDRKDATDRDDGAHGDSVRNRVAPKLPESPICMNASFFQWVSMNAS